ncbi:MAG: FtsQ-type POTRA domain-containing protein, partial [Tetrasphaera sp.]|nr:FtsQ-type POTRA domain-containing protein [Tetrasphaera sp.]
MLWRSDWLLVEEVVVTGVEPRWEEQIRAAADLTIGEPLVQVKSSVTEQAVREVPIVADVHVV